MKDQDKKDLETLSLFLILGLLTIVLVIVVKVVLFGPAGPILFESASRP